MCVLSIGTIQMQFTFEEFEALERKLTEEDMVPTDDDDDDDDDPLMCLLKQRIRECKLRVGPT